MYREGDRFTVDSVNWTDFFAPSPGCDYATFANEDPDNSVEYRQDKTRPETGSIIGPGIQRAIIGARTATPEGGERRRRFAGGQLIGSFKAVSGTASIFPMVQ